MSSKPSQVELGVCGASVLSQSCNMAEFTAAMPYYHCYSVAPIPDSIILPCNIEASSLCNIVTPFHYYYYYYYYIALLPSYVDTAYDIVLKHMILHMTLF